MRYGAAMQYFDGEFYSSFISFVENGHLYLSTCAPRERGLSTVPVPQMTHQQHYKIQGSELWLEGRPSQTRHLYKGPWYPLSSQGTPEETYKRALVPSTVHKRLVLPL